MIHPDARDQGEREKKESAFIANIIKGYPSTKTDLLEKIANHLDEKEEETYKKIFEKCIFLCSHRYTFLKGFIPIENTEKEKYASVLSTLLSDINFYAYISFSNLGVMHADDNYEDLELSEDNYWIKSINFFTIKRLISNKLNIYLDKNFIFRFFLWVFNIGNIQLYFMLNELFKKEENIHPLEKQAAVKEKIKKHIENFKSFINNLGEAEKALGGEGASPVNPDLDKTQSAHPMSPSATTVAFDALGSGTKENMTRKPTPPHTRSP